MENGNGKQEGKDCGGMKENNKLEGYVVIYHKVVFEAGKTGAILRSEIVGSLDAQHFLTQERIAMGDK